MKSWDQVISPPLKGRPPKPRTTGMTMILDKGLSLSETRNILETGADFIDYIKLSFGTLPLYPPSILKKKIHMAADFGIPVYPGGTFLEIAFWEKTVDRVLDQLSALGIQWVEISDGTITLSPEERRQLIAKALGRGFKVITEVGKKDPAQQPDPHRLVQTAKEDLECGAEWVIIEARESGTNIGVYDSHGAVITEKLAAISSVLPLEKIMWEAPLKNQQASLICQFGPGVNLGNIPPTDVIALEALRRGFRSDTWKNIL